MRKIGTFLSLTIEWRLTVLEASVYDQLAALLWADDENNKWWQGACSGAHGLPHGQGMKERDRKGLRFHMPFKCTHAVT
jgi:hypothetical protein